MSDYPSPFPIIALYLSPIVITGYYIANYSENPMLLGSIFGLSLLVVWTSRR